jgi:putative transposase
MRGWRPEFGGLPLKMATVEQTPSGRYTCSLRVAVPGGAPKPLESLGRVIGLDLGLTHFAILDDGRKIENPRLLALAKENLSRKDRKFRRRKKGSKQRERARVLLARAHERVKWARQDFTNKLAHQLSQEADVVVVEDLAVKNMVKNSHLAKAISDVGWSGFVTRLEQKMAAKGGVVVKINRFFPSSKTCSACGVVLSELPLSVREWTCEGCGVTHDRDVNAATNIRNEGIKQLLADGRSVTATGG